ncbi:SDR family NAD(P)-dependent oxidoreductase [Salipiger sp.]|uniref:SDR family NAD(P)-dependent oxidoreductase n=1 Tax=Salipiger sp. TaxID=2078585 RepID=UPI003A97205D
MLDVADRVIMVSGASRGIGRAVTAHLLEQGYRLSCGMRDPSGFGDTDRAMAHVYDAEDPEGARTWAAATAARFGRIDGIVAAAGLNPKVLVFDEGEDDLDRMWRVNVKGPLRLVRAARPWLAESGAGRVVLLGSLAGKRVGSNVGYAMTKFAVTALNHGIRREGRAEGIRSTVICPGYVATDMTLGEDEIPRSEMSRPEDLAAIIGTALRLPDTASVSEMLVHCQFEPML